MDTDVPGLIMHNKDRIEEGYEGFGPTSSRNKNVWIRPCT